MNNKSKSPQPTKAALADLSKHKLLAVKGEKTALDLVAKARKKA